MSMVPTFATGKIDWEKVVRKYAAENEMSFREAMFFLSKRDSVDVAAGLLGIGCNSGQEQVRPIVQSLAEFMDRHGYTPPKLWTRPSDYKELFGVAKQKHNPLPNREERARISAKPMDYSKSNPPLVRQATPEELERAEHISKPREPRKLTVAEKIKAFDHNRREDATMPITLTKEEYLEMRRKGKSRNKIAKDLGYKNSGSLYPVLERWGIKDAAIELAEMDKGTIYPLHQPEPSMRLTEALEATKPGGGKPIIPQAPVPYVPDKKEGQPRISMEAHAEREPEPGPEPGPAYHCWVCGAPVASPESTCSDECAEKWRNQVTTLLKESEPQANAQEELEEFTATQYVTIRIPVPQVDGEVPTRLRTMDRQSVIADVLEKLAACVQWVAMDARELTGQQDVTAMVQAYVERVMVG